MRGALGQCAQRPALPLIRPALPGTFSRKREKGFALYFALMHLVRKRFRSLPCRFCASACAEHSSDFADLALAVGTGFSGAGDCAEATAPPKNVAKTAVSNILVNVIEKTLSGCDRASAWHGQAPLQPTHLAAIA